MEAKHFNRKSGGTPYRLLHYLLLINTLVLSKGMYSQLTFTINNPSGNYSITCTNTLINLFATSNYTASAVSYTWIGSQMSSITASSLGIIAPGIYSVTATAGSLTASQTLAIGMNTVAPSLTLTSNINALSCSVGSVQLLVAANTPSVTYSWVSSFPCSPNYTCIAFMPGTYTVKAQSQNNGCTTSATINIGDNRIYPLLSNGIFTISCPNGTVSINPQIIGSTANLTYSWSVPQMAITSGSNSPSLITNAAGIYNVVVTNTLNGCTSQAQINVWACVGIDEFSSALGHLKIFPNPVSNNLNIEFDAPVSVDKLTITNILGQTIREIKNPTSKQEINVSFLQPGIYLLKAENKKVEKSFKFLKE